MLPVTPPRAKVLHQKGRLAFSWTTAAHGPLKYHVPQLTSFQGLCAWSASATGGGYFFDHITSAWNVPGRSNQTEQAFRRHVFEIHLGIWVELEETKCLAYPRGY